jgi:predicted dithiol-disulfide oxidoreductase (DUF899 family)
MIVSAEVWQHERDELLRAEKEATRAPDALAARRRRLPMVKFSNDYAFDTPAGPKTLADLFDGRDQLVVYQCAIGARLAPAGPSPPVPPGAEYRPGPGVRGHLGSPDESDIRGRGWPWTCREC